MKKILLSLFIFSSCFGIVIEDTEKLNDHIELAQSSFCNSVGYITNEDMDRYITGTLIHPRVVLTVARWVKDTKNLLFHIKIGNAHHVVGGYSIIHPDYKSLDVSLNKRSKAISSNIALLFLDTNFNGLNYPALPKKMPTFPCPCIFTGYGNSNADYPRKLTCYIPLDYSLENIFLTTHKMRYDVKYFGTPTIGDNGGPLMLCTNSQNIIHGIFSHNSTIQSQEHDENGTSKSIPVSTYVSVYHQHDWIKKTMEEHLKKDRFF